MEYGIQNKLKQLGFKFTKGISFSTRIFDPNEKYATYATRYPGTKYKSLVFQAINHYEHRNKYTKDNLSNSKMGIRFDRNYIHFKVFSDEFEKLLESGILEKFKYNPSQDKGYLDYFKIVERQIDLKILTLEDLEAGIFIWLVSVLVAIIVYICEIIYFKITKRENFHKQPKTIKLKLRNKKIQSMDAKRCETNLKAFDLD